MYVLGIETSCDECSAAIVEDGSRILSNVIATQIELHRPFDGVVPELASRLHTEWISQVVNAAVAQAGIDKSEIGAIAATARPGLLGSLLVGLNFAKGMAAVLDVPFIGIDHIRAHLYAPQVTYHVAYPTGIQIPAVFNDEAVTVGGFAYRWMPVESLPSGRYHANVTMTYTVN